MAPAIPARVAQVRVDCACRRTRPATGRRIEISNTIIPITTSNSISVKPRRIGVDRDKRSVIGGPHQAKLDAYDFRPMTPTLALPLLLPAGAGNAFDQTDHGHEQRDHDEPDDHAEHHH